MTSGYLTGTKQVGFDGNPIRSFAGDFDGFEVIGGRNGARDVFMMKFSNIEVFRMARAGLVYPFKTASVEIAYPSQEQIARASQGADGPRLPARSAMGIWNASLDELYAEQFPEGTSLEELAKMQPKQRWVVEGTDRSFEQRDAEGNGTGEMRQFVDWKVVHIVGQGEGRPEVAGGSTDTSMTEEQAISVFLGLIPEDGADMTTIVQLYTGSDLNGGILNQGLFERGDLLSSLVQKGQLTLDENDIYHIV